MPLSHEDLIQGFKWTKERIKFRRYNQRADQWGRGLIDDAVLVGFMGEIAFMKWVRDVCCIPLQVDDRNKLAGDGGIDFRLWRWGIQVKTAKSNYDETFVKTDADCAKVWNVIVRAHWPSQRIDKREIGLFGSDKTRDLGQCDLCGWAFDTEWDRRKVLKRAIRGDHWNYSLDSQYLKPMADLAALFQSKQILAEEAS